MNHYVAYHSVEVMDRDYSPGKTFSFLTRKPENFVRASLGGTAWVIVGSRVAKKMQYLLAGRYTPEKFTDEDGTLVIQGRGIPLETRLDVTNLAWFDLLRGEQNKFSFGYNRIQNPTVITALEAIIPAGGPRASKAAGTQSHVSEKTSTPQELTTPTADPDELERRVSRLMTISFGRPDGEQRPRRVVVSDRVMYERRADVKAWVLKEANGRCDLCRGDGPFKRPDGSLYLELHHAVQLAEGGFDTVDNAVALCANCHRLLHHGADRAEGRNRLYKQVPRLVRRTSRESRHS